MIRGVRPDGSLATAAWGRRDVGQFPGEILDQCNGNSTQTAARNSYKNDIQSIEDLSLNVGDESSTLDMEMEINMNSEVEVEVEVEVEESKNESNGSSSSINAQETINNEGNDITDGGKTIHCKFPQKLSLPNGLSICEIWTGSEFTVVADEQGFLWSSGWNEHGNLGRGQGCDFLSSDEWVKVMRLKCKDDSEFNSDSHSDSHPDSHSQSDSHPDSHSDSDSHSGSRPNSHSHSDSKFRSGVDRNVPRSSGNDISDFLHSSGTCNSESEAQIQRVLEHVRLSVVWEGALACGGGHVLCLTDS